MDRPHTHTFVTLDALRGIAALAVLQFHTYHLFGAQLFPFGYLSVDFFFMLSGFVLTYAYQAKLDAGLRTTSFLKVRCIRLYPVYVLGLLLGFAFFLLQNRYGKVHAGRGYFLSTLVLGLLVLPRTGSGTAGMLAPFPFDFPTWSLFSEAVANIVHAVLLRRRSTLALVAALLVAVVLLLPAVFHEQTLNVGTRRDQVFALVPRVLFPYIMGMLVFRLWNTRKLQLAIPSWVAFLCLLAVLAIPFPAQWALIHDLSALFLVLPALLLVSASTEPSARYNGVCRMIGAASYPLYVLHAPMHDFFEQFWVKLRHHSIATDAPLPGILFMILVLVVALGVERFYDLPLRHFFRNKSALVYSANRRNTVEAETV